MVEHGGESFSPAGSRDDMGTVVCAHSASSGHCSSVGSRMLWYYIGTAGTIRDDK